MLCLVVACVFGAAGARGAVTAESRVATRVVTVDGVPMLEVAPAQHSGQVPAVVVAHGFAGSARLMRGFADTLAARGFVVVLPDFTGHGSNPAPLPAGDGGERSLQRDLAAAVRHVKTLPAVDPSRIALVGHSMGARAVTRYAIEHADIVATVAISLGSGDDLPRQPARPRNLLLLVGAAEFPAFREAARTALSAAYPSAPLGETVGDHATGTARHAAVVPGTEHISILYSTRTHKMMAAWLDAAFGARREGAVHPRDRIVAAGLLVLAFMVGMVALAGLVLSRPAVRGSPELRVLRGRYLYLGLAGGIVVAVVAAGLLPTNRLPLAVGGYAIGFFSVVGVGLLGGWALDRLRRAEPATPQRMTRHGLIATVAITAYAAVAVAVPIHIGFLHAIPVGARWWLLPVVLTSVALLLLGAELASAGVWWRQPLTLAATVAALFLAAFAGLAPSFILLVLPLLVVLFAWQAGWSLVLRRHGAPAWLAAAAGSVVVTWPIVATLPLVT